MEEGAQEASSLNRVKKIFSQIFEKIEVDNFEIFPDGLEMSLIAHNFSRS